MMMNDIPFAVRSKIGALAVRFLCSISQQNRTTISFGRESIWMWDRRTRFVFHPNFKIVSLGFRVKKNAATFIPLRIAMCDKTYNSPGAQAEL